MYVNGSDMLLYVDDLAMGHCTTHTTTMNSETKEHTVKPEASKAKGSGLWAGKTVTKNSISISGEGLIYDGETEAGYKKMLAAWKAGKSVKVKCMERASEKPYLQGACVITSLERTDPANDDATYKISLENDGEPEILDESAFTNDNVAANNGAAAKAAK